MGINALAFLSTLFLLSMTAPLPTEKFTLTWGGHGKPEYLKGWQPTGAKGPFPLFIWVTGTSCFMDTPSDNYLVQMMASHGFVAAQVEYENKQYPQSCAAMKAKSEAIFSVAQPNSALSVLMAKANADVSKGLALMGFSQGSQLAAFSQFWNNLTTAAIFYGHGTSTSAVGGPDLPCMNYILNNSRNPEMGLDRSKIFAINGQKDEVFGCTLDKPNNCKEDCVRDMLGNTSGRECKTGSQCLAPDHSGWYSPSKAEAGQEPTHCNTLFQDGACCYTFNERFKSNPASNPYSFAAFINFLVSKGANMPPPYALNEAVPVSTALNYTPRDEAALAGISSF